MPIRGFLSEIIYQTVNKISIIVSSLLILFSPEVSYAQIKLEEKDGVYYIPCKVNGLDMKFIFDTGASNVSISSVEFLYMIRNGHMNKNDITGTDYYSIANGEIEEGISINIRSMEIGGIKMQNIRASVIKNLNAPLLLGNSALSNFGRFTFDYLNKTLVFDNNENNEVKESFKIEKLHRIEGSGPLSESKAEWIDRTGGANAEKDANGNLKYPLTQEEIDVANKIRAWYSNNQPSNTNKIDENYLGEYKEGKFHGFGTYRYSTGSSYTGNWMDGQMNGQGEYKFTNGSKYTGEFKDGKFHGFGEFTYSNGDKYSGNWHNDMRNGYGTLFFNNGSVKSGYWENDVFVK